MLDRRRVLKGGAVLPLLTVATPAGAGDDAELQAMWREMIDLAARLREINRQCKEAVQRIPAWARWKPRPGGTWDPSPAWTPAMLEEHRIPAEFGDRPDLRELEELNRKYLIEAYRKEYPDEDQVAASIWSFRDEWKNATPDFAKPTIEANNRRTEALKARYAEQHECERQSGLTELGKISDKACNLLCDMGFRINDTPHNGAVGMLIRLRVYVIHKTEYCTEPLNELDYEDQFVIRLVAGLERGAFREIAANLPVYPELAAYMEGVLS